MPPDPRSPSSSTLPVAPLVLFMDFDNLKTIERWANSYMTLTSSASRCRLFIPHKQMADLNGAQAFDNYKAIEYWASRVASGACGCSCTLTTPPPAKCRLFIPHKTVLLDLESGRITLPAAQSREFDNYKAIESWANLYARGECACTC